MNNIYLSHHGRVATGLGSPDFLLSHVLNKFLAISCNYSREKSTD